MNEKDLDYLFLLDGERFVIDEAMGLWVKFEIRKIIPTQFRPHGMRYSFSLHDRYNKRIMGFDNAHSVNFHGNQKLAPKSHDHWHRNESDLGIPYQFKNAGQLLEDFWKEVDKTIKKLKVHHET